MRSVPLLTAAVLLGTTGLSLAAWQRLPVADKVPVNLATKAIPGTRVLSSEGINGSAALISGGSADSASLMAGKDDIVIELVGTHALNELLFTNDSAEGKVFVATSLDRQKWQQDGQLSFTSADCSVSVRFGSNSARYVMVTFDVSKAGSIRNFGLFGATSDKEYKLVQVPGDNSSSVNLAAGVGGSRAIYAWPQPMSTNESEIKKNIFRFPKSKEPYRIIIYDLGSPRPLKEFATSYSERPTRVEVFAFTELPETADWKGQMTMDPTLFNRIKPVATGTDPKGLGHIQLKLEKPITAQYVALRFEPNYNRHAHSSAGDDSWTTGLAMVLTGSSALVQGFEWLSTRPQYTAADGDDTEYEFNVDGVAVGAFSPDGKCWTFQPLFNTGTGPNPGDNANGNGSGSRTFSADLPPDLSSIINNLLSSHSAAGAGNTNPFTAGFTPFTITPFTPPNFPPVRNPPAQNPPTVQNPAPPGSPP